MAKIVRKPRKTRAKKPTGYVVYRGPSLLNGDPIVVIALVSQSTNGKTGRMRQTYILHDTLSPWQAVKAGKDECICGDCKHRGVNGSERTCYVDLGHGPSAVFDCFIRGGYPDISSDPAAIRALYIGRKVRLGAYGDPAAAPVSLWLNLTVNAKGWTGYTHQWRRFPAFKLLCMASVDSPSERAEARALGWRTFRAKRKGDPGEPLEIICPASEEAGKRTQCERCLLCAGDGRPAKDIVIDVHGIGARNFKVAA
jgi:hypothetical protein